MHLLVKQLFFLTLIKGMLFAQVMSVDMNPFDTGIQNSVGATTSNETFIIELVASNFSGVSGYQFKIAFDSSKFDFLGGQEDHGLSGTKNILKNSGGSITGIFQEQTNPPCDSILDVAYTILGTTDLSVSGDGLIGIVQFKSKLNSGESGNIIIKDGYWIDFGGTKTLIDNYSSGVYSFDQTKIKTYKNKHNERYNIYSRNNSLNFTIPFSNMNNQLLVKISLYDLQGKLISVLLNEYKQNGVYKIPLNKKLTKGFYICDLKIGDYNNSLKIFIKD